MTGDRVEPSRARASLRAIAASGAPDRGEGLLSRVLCPAVVAEMAQGHREDRSREAPIELVEGVAVADPDALDEPAVRFSRSHRNRHIVRGYGSKAGSGFRLAWSEAKLENAVAIRRRSRD